MPHLRRPVGLRDVHAAIGPSGGFKRSTPRVPTRRRPAASSSGPGLVPQTIELIGNRWSAAALAAALFGARRFTDMLTLTGAPPAIVADRLRTFCQMGVLETVTRPGSGRAEYRLTDKGRAFFPHVMMMLEWGDRWFRAPRGRPRCSPTSPAAASSIRCCTARSAGAELHGTCVGVGQAAGAWGRHRYPARPGRDTGCPYRSPATGRRRSSLPRGWPAQVSITWPS